MKILLGWIFIIISILNVIYQIIITTYFSDTTLNPTKIILIILTFSIGVVMTNHSTKNKESSNNNDEELKN